MLNIDELKGVMAPLNKFGQDEITFSVPSDSGEVEVTLRALYPREEIAAQRYAAAILEKAIADEGAGENSNLSRPTAIEYMDAFRAEIVAYALVQIGRTDLRQMPFIEKTEGTKKVKIEKHVAIRELVRDNWSRGMLTIAFSHYGNLVTKIAEKADKVVAESVADLDAEIERLERRLAGVREERERRAKGDPSVTSQQIKTLLEAGQQMERDIEQAIDEVDAERRAATHVDHITREARPDDLDFSDLAGEGADEEAAPEVEEAPPAPPPAPARASSRQPVIPPRVPPPTQPPRPAEQFRSSFEDDTHPDSQAVELQRLEAAEAAAHAAARRRLPGMEEAVSLTMQAEDLGVVLGEDGQPKRGSDGEPMRAFRLPTETISPRGRQAPPAQPTRPPVINQPPKGGELNPKFRKPGG